uniref:Uncharacterized protein n=1 Tax=Cacopsylla melanoneura TaxID=428564 RepID=A0A8D9A5H4_9HEMI
MQTVLILLGGFLCALLVIPRPVHGSQCSTVPDNKGLLCISGDETLCKGDILKFAQNKCNLKGTGYTASCTRCSVCGTELYKDCCQIKKDNEITYFSNNGPKDIIPFPQ